MDKRYFFTFKPVLYLTFAQRESISKQRLLKYIPGCPKALRKPGSGIVEGADPGPSMEDRGASDNAMFGLS